MGGGVNDWCWRRRQRLVLALSAGRKLVVKGKKFKMAAFVAGERMG